MARVILPFPKDTLARIDILVGRCCIEAAGGVMVDINGNPVTEKSVAAIGGPAHIVQQVFPLFKQCYGDYNGFR